MLNNANSTPDGANRQTAADAFRHPALTPDEWVAAPGELASSELALRQPWRKEPIGSDDLEAAVAKLIEVSRGKPAARGSRDLDSLFSFAVEGERRARETTFKTATALDSVARWIERAEDRLAESDIVSKALDQRIESVLHGLETKIAQIETRVSTLSAGPLGRRGLDPREEVRDAIAAIRYRQDELEACDAGFGIGSERANAAPDVRPAGTDSAALRSLHEEMARLMTRLETVQPAAPEPDALTVEGIRDEIGRLQASIAGLATRAEVGALERSIVDFAERVACARDQRDIAAVEAAFAGLQTEVRRLSDAVASELPDRLTNDIESLTRKIGSVVGTGVSPFVVDDLSREIAEMRRVLADLAEPRRVQDLSRFMEELRAEVADIATRQADVSSLKSGIEEIRSALRAARAETGNGADYAQRFDRLSHQIERLSDRVHGALPGAGHALESGALLQRLDRLDESLRQPARGDDLKSIEDLLRTLVGKLDQAERAGSGSDALDAIERQVAALAERIEKSPHANDPTLAALERAMTDLMLQVETMRDHTSQAVEQAARTAVADTLGAAPAALTGGANFSAFERDLAELKAHQSASDRRTHDALTAVQLTLEQVVDRLASLEGGGVFDAPRGSARATASAADLLQQEESRAGTSSAAHSTPAVGCDGGGDEILLEPGAGRPRAESPTARAGAADEVNGADIKATFIAAARRAAQAAAAEAASQSKSARPKKPAKPVRGQASAASLVTRAKAVIDARRRPILLGLAAVVLAIGALQVGGDLLGGGSKPAVGAAPQRPDAPAQKSAEPTQARETAPQGGLDPKTTESLKDATRAAAEPAASQPSPSAARERDPSFTSTKREVAAAPSGKTEAPATPKEPAQAQAGQPKAGESPAAGQALASLPASTAANAPVSNADATPGLSGRIANMASVGELPVVAGLPALRTAALAGEPAAVYELASRAAEGRGTARDLKVAAKLFEKAAAHGLVPAQYRTGNFYEKGIGVTRDLALAKQWYQRAAEKGNAKAMHNLAVLLAEGGGGKPDYAAAVEWFRRGAEHGVRDSQFNLAVLQVRGLGTAQDLAGAYVWFAIAAKQGDDDAGKKRDEIGARMPQADLANAKAAAERWRATTPNPAANDVALPAHGWNETPEKKTAGGQV